MPKINGSVLIKISRKELELLLSSVRVMIKRCEEITSSNPYSDILSDFTKIKNQWSEKEKEYIQEVLISTQGNKTKAAEILGINRKTLREKLK